ncbi:MAG: GAF domain-containing sensor histidine kinase [Bacteroidetes bacterium]|nr:GAF domain-containing sensor histidine kinase [Bacteroidota bacterium]
MKFTDFKQQLDEQNNKTESNTVLGKKAQNLEIILEIVNSINESLILDEVLELVLSNAIKFTNSDRGFILLADENGKLQYNLGLDSDHKFLVENSFHISNTIISEVYNSGQSKFVEGAQSDADTNKSQSIFALALETILCSPLITGDQKVGVIYVDSKTIHKIKIKEITDTYEILAGQAATAIRNAQLYNGQIQAFNALQESNTLLTQAKEDAEKSDRLKSEFLAQMSHEIRTPLHILMSYSTFLKEEIAEHLDDELSSNFSAIEDAGKRIIRTTDLILNMSEVQTGNYDYIPSQFSIYDEIIENLLKDYAEEIERKKLKISVVRNERKDFIEADKYSIFQVFSNLIDNAIKYTNEGSIQVSIARNGDKNLFVSVADSGIGISESYMPNLFKPFSQEEQGYSRKYEGNGLGLALIKNYCDLNNAQIEVKSKKSSGSTFIVTFLNSSEVTLEI